MDLGLRGADEPFSEPAAVPDERPSEFRLSLLGRTGSSFQSSFFPRELYLRSVTIRRRKEVPTTRRLKMVRALAPPMLLLSKYS